MSYKVAIQAPARKRLIQLPEKMQTRLAQAMLALENNPRPSGVVKLSGRDAWRIRVGDYRIIYTINDTGQEVVVYALGHRREIYR